MAISGFKLEMKLDVEILNNDTEPPALFPLPHHCCLLTNQLARWTGSSQPWTVTSW